MLRVILGLIVAVLVVAIAWFLAGLPGTVSAEIGDYSFDAAAPVVALGLLLLFIVLYLAVSPDRFAGRGTAPHRSGPP